MRQEGGGSMSTPALFQFEGREIRVVTDENGEPLFVGKNVCESLGYANAADAIARHCKGVVKRYPLQTAGGMQDVRVLAEPDVLRLIVNCTLPAAVEFERLVFEEILPSIRKTGSYTAPAAAKRPSRATPSLLSDARAIDFIGNMIAKVPGARLDVVAAIKLRMIEDRTGIPATQFGGALPAEALEKAVKLNPTEIGKRLTPRQSPNRINKTLIYLGLQRKSESGHVLTEAGTAHGESRPFQADNSHVGDQIHWHESVIELVRAALPLAIAPPAADQAKLI
jgi:prophage antirepressor-like protein